MTEILFVLSVALAHALTNFDNLVVMLVLAPMIGPLRCTAVYVAAQLVSIGVAGVLGAAALALLGTWVGFVGFVPIGLGIYTLWQQTQADLSVPKARPTSIWAALLLFLGLGIDTTVVLAALLGDSTDVWDGLIYLGAGMSLVGIVTVFLFLSRMPVSRSIFDRLSRLAPFAMILVGTYILSNSVSDAI